VTEFNKREQNEAAPTVNVPILSDDGGAMCSFSEQNEAKSEAIAIRIEMRLKK
jgi:hypothetical protein